jgi:TPR repeat protein
VAWYRKAAELGNPGGQRALGLMYLEGRGVPQNLAEASKWLKLVAQPQFASPKQETTVPAP